MNRFEYIRKTYKVPAWRDSIVKYKGESYVISWTSGPHLKLRHLLTHKPAIVHPKDPDLKYDQPPEEEG